MVSIHLYCFLALMTLSSSSYGYLHRVRRGISRIDANQQIFYPTLPNEYGGPSADKETHLQETNYYLLNSIHAELNQIEALIRKLTDQYNSIHMNTNIIKSFTLPSEYGPPMNSLYNEKFIRDNTETIQSSINNLKSIAQNLENELKKDVKIAHSRLTDKKLVLNANQHYHINAAGVLPEFLTLDPFVGYGPSPNVNFAPPAPGASSDSGAAVSDDIYSPPDGVLLAPPAPGKFPIRTRDARLLQ